MISSSLDPMNTAWPERNRVVPHGQRQANGTNPFNGGVPRSYRTEGVGQQYGERLSRRRQMDVVFTTFRTYPRHRQGNSKIRRQKAKGPAKTSWQRPTPFAFAVPCRPLLPFAF
jgi:hypothetical protein